MARPECLLSVSLGYLEAESSLEGMMMACLWASITRPKAHYRQYYYEAIDLIITCIHDRFNQPGYRFLGSSHDESLQARAA